MGDIPPPASDYRSAATSVDTSGQMTRVLNDIASILENDIGGSGIWYDRVLNAKNDLTQRRRAKLACMLFFPRLIFTNRNSCWRQDQRVSRCCLGAFAGRPFGLGCAA